MAAKRTVFSIVETGGGGLGARVSRAPIKVKDNVRPLTLAAPGPLDTQEQIAEHGTKIRNALNEHVEIHSVLDGIQKAPNAETWDILFEISSSSGDVGEAIRWEVIRDTADNYLTLHGKRRLFRVATEPSCPDFGVRTLPNPIRFAAFLSPAQVSATDELDGLVKAVTLANSAGLNMNLTVYVGQPELLNQTYSGFVICKPIPSSTLELQSELNRLKPHFLHFFCHGQSESPQRLEFATIAEQRADAPNGSVLFSVDRLIQSDALSEAWTVVFNCCDGGRPAHALNSMAFRLVADVGVPAAIGMGSPLPAGAAPLFSQAFYATLFNSIARSVAAMNNGAVVIDFGESIVAGRQALHEAFENQAVKFNCWALPIIYLHRQDLLVQRPAAPDSTPSVIADRVRTISGMLQLLPTTTPAPARKEMLALFDRVPVVPTELRCDEYGRFPTEGRTA